MKRFLHPLMIAFIFASFSAMAQNNWTQTTVGLDLTYSPSSMVTLDNGDVILASSKAGSPFLNKFYKSTDAGTNWIEFTPLGLTDLGNIHSIKRTPTYLVLIGRGTSQSDAVIYRSSDNGNSWMKIDTDFDDSYSPQDIVGISTTAWYITASRAPASTWEHVIYKSTNQGSSWSIMTTTGLDNAGLSYAMSAVGNDLLLTALNKDGTTGNEIYKSTDGGTTWGLSQFGFNEQYAGTDIIVRSNGVIYMTASRYSNTTGKYDSRLYFSNDNGDSWDLTTTTGLDNLGNTHGIEITGSNLLICGYHVTTSNGGLVFKSEMPPTVGVQDIETNHLNSYPNPFNEYLNIDVNQPAEMQLTSITGKVIMQANGTTMNTENVVPGVYFLTVKTATKTITTRVIKQ